MTKKRVFHKGFPVTNIHEVIVHLQMEHWLYFRGVPKHHSVLKNMALIVLENHARGGYICLAERNKESK